MSTTNPTKTRTPKMKATSTAPIDQEIAIAVIDRLDAITQSIALLHDHAVVLHKRLDELDQRLDEFDETISDLLKNSGPSFDELHMRATEIIEAIAPTQSIKIMSLKFLDK